MGLKVGTVFLEEYNKDWIKMFNDEKENIEKLLKGYSFQIEHVGSTSIQGLKSKPIIDIVIGLNKLSEFNNFKKSLKKKMDII